MLVTVAALSTMVLPGRAGTPEEAAGVMGIMTTVLITPGELSNQRNGSWVLFERAVPLA